MMPIVSDVRAPQMHQQQDRPAGRVGAERVAAAVGGREQRAVGLV